MGHVHVAVFLTRLITSNLSRFTCTSSLTFLTWRFTLLLPGSGGPQPIVVHEGENVRLRCAVTGNPRPAVEWRRLDPSVIPLGSWQGGAAVSCYIVIRQLVTVIQEVFALILPL